MYICNTFCKQHGIFCGFSICYISYKHYAHILLTKSPLCYFKHLNFLNVRDKFLRSKIQYHLKCVWYDENVQMYFLYNVKPYVHKWPLFLQLNPKLSQTNVTLMIWCGVNFHPKIFSVSHEFSLETENFNTFYMIQN